VSVMSDTRHDQSTSARRAKTEHLVRRFRATGSLYSPWCFDSAEDEYEPGLPIELFDNEGAAL
jgi:hypothetical protein